MARDKIDNLISMRSAVRRAKEHVAKVGKVEHHIPNGVGCVHSVKVDIQINHQEYAGATNYWREPEFDAAVAAVVRSRFDEIAADAIALMEKKTKEALIDCRSYAEGILAEIEAAEEED